MDFLIHFFRDILDGPLYWILVGVCFFLIIFILGFLVDRHEKKERFNDMVESSPAGKERIYVTDEISKIEDSNEQGSGSLQEIPITEKEKEEMDSTKSVGILELSSDDYKDGAVEVSDSNN